MASQNHLGFSGSTLTRRDFAGFSLREIVHPPGVFIPKHSHENAHVGFILNGAFTERFARRALECKPLSVSYLPPGLTHTDDFRHGVHCLVLEIAPRRLECVRQLVTLGEPIFENGGPAAWLTMRLYHEARQTDEASSLAAEGLALELLAELVRQHAKPRKAKAPRWLDRAREVLQRQFEERLTHDDLARLVGVHPVHLATVFRRHFGCTIGEYVRNLRIDFASQRIAASEDPLCDVGAAAGFSDQSHFSRVFKRQTGMTPGQFRANLRRA